MFGFNITDAVLKAITNFFKSFLDEVISYFSNILVDIMGTSLNVLYIPLVQNGIKYAQVLAFTLLIAKAINEAFQTYILHQNGDPDADPTGLLIRTGQAVAVIATLPWIVKQVFIFGTKVATDVANISSVGQSATDWTFLVATFSITSLLSILLLLGVVIILLIIAIQATIRGAELALMAVLGPIMALNLTANNRSMWSSWFRQVVIICTGQALQIFMLKGALSLATINSISSNGILLLFGWLWVTVKTPKFVKQFAYSTGLSGTVGGTAKQAGTMYVMRKIVTK